VHSAAAEGLDIAAERVVMKRRARRRAGEQHEKTGESGRDFVVGEGGHRFIVNLEAHLDTGLFLDHRNTRALVQEEAKGKRFLNLFSYTGSFTVYAAAGGATSVVRSTPTSVLPLPMRLRSVDSPSESWVCRDPSTW